MVDGAIVHTAHYFAGRDGYCGETTPPQPPLWFRQAQPPLIVLENKQEETVIPAKNKISLPYTLHKSANSF